MLTTAQAGCSQSLLGCQLGQLQLPVTLLSWKDKHRCRCLSRVSWLGCMPDNSGTHLKVTAAAVCAVQEAVLKGPVSPIEAYSCDLCILDTVQDSQQITCVTSEDCHQAQQIDPALSLVISRLQDGTLGNISPNWPIHQNLVSSCGNETVFYSGHPVQMFHTQGVRGDPLLVGPASCTERVALKGYHDEVGHLGQESMLDLMHDQFFWPHMAAQAKEHIGKWHLCLAFKAN